MIKLTAHHRSLWADLFYTIQYAAMVECVKVAFSDLSVHYFSPEVATVTAGSELELVIVAETGATADNLHKLRGLLLQRFPSLRKKAWDLHLYVGAEKVAHLPFRYGCLE